MRRLPCVVILTALAVMAAVQPAMARSGVLECQGGRHVPRGIRSVSALDCVFLSPGRPPRPYIAIIRRTGVAIGFVETMRFSWTVNSMPPGSGGGRLAGSYRGIGASASLGVGFGGNILVGGRGNPYALQPVSVQGQTGLNLAAGVADLELKPVLVSRGGPRMYRAHAGFAVE